jgi:hypothetical protein
VEQEGRFFHGYYDCYCYLPLYVFCGRDLLAANLRRAERDAADGAVEEIARVVARIVARQSFSAISVLRGRDFMSTPRSTPAVRSANRSLSQVEPVCLSRRQTESPPERVLFRRETVCRGQRPADRNGP